MTKVGDEWNGSKLCANLIYIRDIPFIHSKTRNYAAVQYRLDVASMTILSDSKVSSYFANIFLKFSKPKAPTRLYTIEDEVLNWLNEQLKNRK